MSWLDNATVTTAEQKAAEAAQAEQDRINAEALRYLASTDWYIVRLQETSKAVPVEVLEERQAARDRIV